MPGSHLCRLSGERYGIVARDVEEMDVRDHARAFETVSEDNLGVVLRVAGMVDGNGCNGNASLVHGLSALGTKSSRDQERGAGRPLIEGVEAGGSHSPEQMRLHIVHPWYEGLEYTSTTSGQRLPPPL